METGLAKLIELLQQVWMHLKPYAAIYSWQHGALMRRGVFRRALSPGYYSKWPIVDMVIPIDTAVQTMRGPTQTIGGTHFKWTAKYHIEDVEKYTCDIVDEVNYLRDVLTAHAAAFILEVNTSGAWDNMMKRMRAEAAEGGFKVHKFRMVDTTDGLSFRMFSDVGEMEEGE
jgi:hypothetical protein